MKLVKIKKAKAYANNGNPNGPHAPAVSAIYGIQNDNGMILARIFNVGYKTWEVIENGGQFHRIINRPFDSKIEAFEAAKKHFIAIEYHKKTIDHLSNADNHCNEAWGFADMSDGGEVLKSAIDEIQISIKKAKAIADNVKGDD